ncbi:MAG: DUF4364 family protein [Clostridia bacterium]|nr:DUF4364 family protein [Clostridia bacterium]
MKKNIWDNVYYRLNYETEIKLSVLFSIRYADLPVTDIEIKHFMLSATSVDFMVLCSIIDSMLSDNYIKKVWRDEVEKFDLTDRGNEMLDMFEDKIMASVRSSLKDAINEYFRREHEKAQAQCEIVPLGKDKYQLDIVLKEGKDTLFAMSVFAGSRENAIRLRRGFHADPMGAYTGFITALAKAANNEDEA